MSDSAVHPEQFALSGIRVLDLTWAQPIVKGAFYGEFGRERPPPL